MKLAQNTVEDVLGKITPPPGPSRLYGDPITGVGQLFGTFLTVFMLAAGVILLIYLMWGAIDWVLSEGDKEKLSRAQLKITNALVGMLFIVVGLTLFGIITGNILGIVKHTPAGWQFEIPFISVPCDGECRESGINNCQIGESEDHTKKCDDIGGHPRFCCMPVKCSGECRSYGKRAIPCAPDKKVDSSAKCVDDDPNDTLEWRCCVPK